jgi:hypothetical protein
MSGLLSVVVARLPRVLDKGIYVSHSSIEDNYAKYIESSNPIRAFVESSIKKDESKNELKDALYDAYVRFCKDKKLGIESNYSFSRILKKEHGLKDDKLTKDRKRDYYWLGVELKDWKEAEEGQDTLH